MEENYLKYTLESPSHTGNLMYQQKCPIYQNSKAVRDMVLLLIRGMGVGVSRVNMDQAHHKGGGWWIPSQGGQYQGGHGYHGGAPPQSVPFPPGGQMPRDWRTGWTDKCHPKIKAMMHKYLEHTHGQIHLAEILKAAGKTQKDLPTLPKYVHPTVRPFLCWSSVLGKSGFRDCRFRKEGGHPLQGDITEEFANQVIDVIGKGVVPPSIQHGGSPPKKHIGEGAQR